MISLAWVRAFDVLVRGQVGRGEERVEPGQAQYAPDGEETNDHDHNAGWTLSDGINKGALLSGVTPFFLAHEDQVSDSTGKNENAQKCQWDWKKQER